MVCHGGQHYISYARDFETGRWYHCDDTDVQPINNGRIQEIAASGRTNDGLIPYILFYTLKTNVQQAEPDAEEEQEASSQDEPKANLFSRFIDYFKQKPTSTEKEQEAFTQDELMKDAQPERNKCFEEKEELNKVICNDLFKIMETMLQISIKLGNASAEKELATLSTQADSLKQKLDLEKLRSIASLFISSFDLLTKENTEQHIINNTEKFEELLKLILNTKSQIKQIIQYEKDSLKRKWEYTDSTLDRVEAFLNISIFPLIKFLKPIYDLKLLTAKREQAMEDLKTYYSKTEKNAHKLFEILNSDGFVKFYDFIEEKIIPKKT